MQTDLVHFHAIYMVHMNLNFVGGIFADFPFLWILQFKFAFDVVIFAGVQICHNMHSV